LQAQVELQHEGFDGPINRKEAFVNLASTLDKLLNRLEKSNRELDELDKRLRVAAEAAKKRLLEQRMKSAELLKKMREKQGEKSPEGAAVDEKTSQENVLQQIEKSNADLEKRLREAQKNKLATKKFLEEQRLRSTELLKKMQEKQAMELKMSDEEQATEAASAGLEKPRDTEEKEGKIYNGTYFVGKIYNGTYFIGNLYNGTYFCW
jgi:hypothetical protein